MKSKVKFLATLFLVVIMVSTNFVIFGTTNVDASPPGGSDLCSFGGVTHASYLDEISGTDQVFYQNNSGGSWNDPVQMTTSAEDKFDALVSIDVDTDVCYVLWTEEGASENEFWYKSSVDYANWSASINSTLTADLPSSPNLDMEADGHLLYATWDQGGELLISVNLDENDVPDDMEEIEGDSETTGETLLCSDWARVGLYNAVNFSEFGVAPVTVNGTTYHNLTIDDIDWSYTTELGKPMLPVLRKYITVPYDSEVDIEIYDSSYTTEEDYYIYPVPNVVLEADDNDNETTEMGVEEFYINETFYSTDIFYPENIVSVELDTQLRNYRVLLLNIAPFQFNPVTKELKVYDEIVFATEFGQTGIGAELEQEEGADGGYFKDIYSNLILNYGASADWGVIESTNPGEGEVFSAPVPPETNPPRLDYLIIAHDNFIDNEALINLANWRASYNNFRVGMIATSNICTNPILDDDIEIKEYIKSGMEGLGVAYVLLVGDAEYITPHEVVGSLFPSYNTETTSDNWFVDSNNDHYPDMMIGRLSVSLNPELEIICNKIINYEENPNWGMWRDNMLLIANGIEQVSHDELDEIFVDYLYPFDVTKVRYLFGGIKDDVIQAFNQGQVIVNYDDHGGPGGWGLLSNSDVPLLTNGDKLPVVFSMACLTGMLDYQYDDCFAEYLLAKENGGSVAFFGASEVASFTSVRVMNDYLFSSIFDDDMHIIGEIIFNTKWLYGNIYESEMYTLFGDPALEINLPEDVEVTVSASPSEIEGGQVLTIQASVSDDFDGDAKITVTDYLSNEIASPIYTTVVDGAISTQYVTLDGDAYYGIGGVNVYVWDDSTETDGVGGDKFEILPQDLSISEEDISFDYPNPFEDYSVEVTATIHKTGSVTSTATVKFYEGDPDDDGVQFGPGHSITLYDDEEIIDVTETWDGGDEETSYDIFVRIEEVSPSEPTGNNIASREITVGTYVDPSLQTAFDIQFEPRWPYVGEEVELTATLYNQGDADIVSVTIEFYDGDPEYGGVYIGESYVNDIMANGGSNTSTATMWTAFSDEHEIYAVVAETDPVEESYYTTNNETSRYIYGMTDLEVPVMKFSDNDTYKSIEFNETIREIEYSIKVPNKEVTYAIMDVEGVEREFEDVVGTEDILLPSSIRPVGIAWGPDDGLLYIASRESSSSGSIWKRLSDSSYVQVGSSLNIDIRGLEFDSSGILYVCNRGSSSNGGGQLYACDDLSDPEYTLVATFDGTGSLPPMMITDISFNEFDEAYVSGTVYSSSVALYHAVSCVYDSGTGWVEYESKRLELDFSPVGIATNTITVDELYVTEKGDSDGYIHRFVDSNDGFYELDANYLDFEPWGATFEDQQLWISEYAVSSSTTQTHIFEWGYPISPSIDVGDDETIDWQESGRYQSKDTVLDYSDAINDYIEANQEEVDSEGNIEVPIVFSTSSAGILNISEIATIYYDDSILISQDTGTEERFYGLDWSPDGSTCILIGNSATSPVNNVVVKFDGIEYTELYNDDAATNSFFRRVKWCPDGSYALIGSAGGKVFKYDPSDDSVSEFYSDAITTAYFYDIAWQPDTDSETDGYQGLVLFIASSSSTADFVIDYDGSSFTKTYTSSYNKLKRADWRHDGAYAVITGSSGTMYKFDGTTMTSVSTGTSYYFKPYWYEDDSDCLLLENDDLYVYDGSSVNYLTSTPDSEYAYSADWYEEGGFFMLSCRYGILLKYYPDTDEFVEVDGDVTDYLYEIEWRPDDNYALVIGQDNHIFKYVEPMLELQWLEKDNPDIIVHWSGVIPTTQWNVYYSTDRFASFPLGWTLATVASSARSWTHEDAYSDGNTYYYIVTANNDGVLSANSKIGVKARLSLAPNEGNTDYVWISLPYNSEYETASDIVMELEGALTGPDLDSKISMIRKINPSTQVYSSFLYEDEFEEWTGDDFTITPCDGICLLVTSSFNWVITGTDSPVELSFTHNTGNTNFNWISLPYTGTYTKASDIVMELEGALTGQGLNTKINVVGKWLPQSQVSTGFVYDDEFEEWTGDDFTINPGDGFYLSVTSDFTWTPSLITPEVP